MNLIEINDDDVRAFLEESYENLNQIEQDIINLEKAPTQREILVRIYRGIHTIKGNCGFLPFPRLESVAHASESLLGRLRDGSLTVNAKIITALLQTSDTIREILHQIQQEGKESDRSYAELIQTLEQLQNFGGGNTQQNTDSNYTTSEPASPQAIDQSTTIVTEAVSETTIRVSVKLLDRLINLLGELVLTRNQLLQIADSCENPTLSTTCQRLDFITNELQVGVMQTRMQPISNIWRKFDRLVRDLAASDGKQVQLQIEGANTELDKSIIEAIKDPLTHIVRNCIDHGLETPTERHAMGKATTGKLLLQAYHHNGKVRIEISDDGRGINPEQLKQKAQQLGLINSTTAASLSDSEALNLIFLPGLSTTSAVTNLSGRGMGMDIVKTNIEKINGIVEVHSQIGQGTTFHIKIPLTLAIIPALIVNSGGTCYVIPQSSIQELVRLESEQILEASAILYNVPVLKLRQKLIPLVYLNELLNIDDHSLVNYNNINAVKLLTKLTDKEILYIVIIQTEDYDFGLIVDAIEDTQNIVVKPISRQLKSINIFSGTTILSDGKIALIIDAINLAKRAGFSASIQDKLFDSTKLTEIEIQDQQMVLLFQAANDARMGISLNLVYRLEEFPDSLVQKIGNQYVIQYGSQILPLIDLNTVFTTANTQLSTSSEDTIQVIVVLWQQEQYIGLVVEKIIDIVEERLEIKGIGTRPGIKSLILIQDQITEMLDLEEIVQIANPYLIGKI